MTRAVRLLPVLALLALLALPGRAWAKPEVPQNLTLTALAGGVWRLTWDPILDDALNGYTVWARSQGKGEFLKISKQPLARAIFQFKGLDMSRQSEFVVTADYESGRSDPSLPAFPRLAWRDQPEAPVLN